MFKTILITMLLATSVFAELTKRTPVYDGLVIGCSYGVWTNPNPSLSTAEQCSQCIIGAPIKKSEKISKDLVDECVQNYNERLLKNEK
jgi:hypothetical protein